MHGALAASGKCPQAKWLSTREHRGGVQSGLGAVLETGEFFEESKPEQALLSRELLLAKCFHPQRLLRAAHTIAPPLPFGIWYFLSAFALAFDQLSHLLGKFPAINEPAVRVETFGNGACDKFFKRNRCRLELRECHYRNPWAPHL